MVRDLAFYHHPVAPAATTPECAWFLCQIFSVIKPLLVLDRGAEHVRHHASRFDELVPRDASGPTGVQPVHDRRKLCWGQLSPVIETLSELPDSRPFEPAFVVHIELYEHLTKLLLVIIHKELEQSGLWCSASFCRPLSPARRYHPKGIENDPRPLLVDLLEERREDAPHLDEFRCRHEQGLIAQSRVQEHALVCISHISVLEVLVVRHVHHG
mmetsp:Transcript_16673/g.37394  ORF Transcript_16673/g.37394 Transcript_16673/m.37394 type:complete len:213 (+) Transcript_16673:2141-2779(+)